MRAPYRNDPEALQARLSVLQEELVEVRARRDDLAALVQREAELRSEIESIQSEVDGVGRRLRILEDVRVASPCSAAWDDMIGGDRVRFCTHCKKDVYNLSEMSRDEAETFLAECVDEPCVRLYRRRDGTVLTSDCPVGRRTKFRGWRPVAALCSLLLSALVIRGYLSPDNLTALLRKLGIEPEPRDEQILMGALGP